MNGNSTAADEDHYCRSSPSVAAGRKHWPTCHRVAVCERRDGVLAVCAIVTQSDIVRFLLEREVVLGLAAGACYGGRLRKRVRSSDPPLSIAHRPYYLDFDGRRRRPFFPPFTPVLAT